MAFPLSESWFHAPSHDDGTRAWRNLPAEHAGVAAAHPLSGADEQIVAGIRAGDQVQFRVLYETSHDLMLRLAYSYVRSASAAQDVVADVFVALWERRATWRPVRSVRAYLLAAVRNRALDLVRHDQVVARAEAAVSPADMIGATHAPPPATPDAEVELDEARRRLRHAMASLSPDRRRALMLRWQEGLSPTEIAAVMGIPRAAVDQLVSRAIRALRASIGE